MFLSTADPHERTDPAEALVREVGAQLREVRLERGEELEQVAQHLRIKRAYLHAIEQGDLAALPGRPYALGFLRTYADYLGFDGNELIVKIRNVVGNLTNRSRLHIPTPLPESRLPRAPILVLSLVLVAGVYAGWLYVQSGDAPVVETVSEVPDELRPMALQSAPASAFADADQVRGAADGPEETVRRAAAAARSELEARSGNGSDLLPSTANEPASAVSEAGTGMVAAAPEPKIEDTVGAEVRLAGAPLLGNDEQEAGLAPDTGSGPEPDNSADGTTGEEPAAAPNAQEVLAALDVRFQEGGDGAPRVYAADNTSARVILLARSTSWIQISSPDGSYREAATLLPGEAFLVPDRSGLTLWTGNAGGLEVIVDGRRVPPLGREGAVMRRVSLDPEALLEGAVGGAD